MGTAEILKGPQSPLYGSDAASGVMNFIPDIGKPGEAPSFTVRARGGSDDTFEETFKLKGGTAKSGYAASLSRLDTEGHLPNDGYYRTVGTVGLDHFLSDNAKLRFLYHANRNHYDLPGPAHQGYTEPNKYRDLTEQLIGARAHLKLFPWLEFVPRVSVYLRDTLDENKPDELDPSASKTETDGTRLHFDNQVNVRLTGEQLGLPSLRRSISTLGAEWETEDISIKSASAFGDSEYDSDRRATSFYAQQQFQFQNGFTLAGGARVDTFDVGEDETTGKLSASYKIPGTGARIRGAVGEGVKRPSFAELLDVYGPGNPNLKSERQRSWEAGFDQFLAGKKLKFSATYYNNEIDDLIAWSAGKFPNGTNYENIRKARIKGAELSMSLVDFHDFSAHASFNTMDTITLDDGGVDGAPSYVEGEELLRRPDWWWSASISYHPERVKATLRVNTVGDRWDIDDSAPWPFPRVVNPGFTRVDLALSLDVVKDRISMFDKTRKSRLKDLTVELKVNNALDEEYEAIYGFESPGAQWFAGVRAVF